jgi:hypothetical protein
MPQTHEYQLVHGQAAQVDTTLKTQAPMGWKPILLSTSTISHAGGSQIVVFAVLERAMGGQ